MNNSQPEWDVYLDAMIRIHGVELTDERRAELLLQFRRIAEMAERLMALPLDDRLEIAGVYKA